MNPYALLLVAAFVLMVLYGTFARGKKREPGAAWILVLGLVGVVIVLRIYEIINYLQVWVVYASMVTLNYAITFYISYIRYEDPSDPKKAIIANGFLQKKRVKVAYVVPVYNEPVFILRCVRSIQSAAIFAKEKAIDTEIIVVNDASPDNTWDVLNEAFGGIEGITLINLSKNAGKKGALTTGTLGGENWRYAYREFKRKYGRSVEVIDRSEIISLLRKHECNPVDADFFLYTDSDSIIDNDFIYNQVVAFLCEPNLGALSGHCDVWIDPNEEPTFVTKMQVAWYSTQFRVRKAAEGRSVFCVSGPGAGFRAEALYPVLPKWVDDWYGDRIYRGATDRMLTLLILIMGWWVQYSAICHSNTVVPSSFAGLRAQWTRWKQNFWRMIGPVWRYAWRAPLSVAYLTYSRIIVTVFAPFVMIEHVSAILLGDFSGSIVYLVGLMAMGSLMGVAHASRKQDEWRYAILRPLLSVVSAIWGSTLTLRALYLDRKGAFTWREAKKTNSRGRILNRWFVPTFETRLFTWILIAVSIVWIFRFLNRF